MKAYNGKTPVEAVSHLDKELEKLAAAGMVDGSATLTLHFKDGKLKYYTTGGEFTQTCDMEAPIGGGDEKIK
jgi:hypothetical protein